MIVLNDVSKSFGKKSVLSHVSLTINPGEFVCVVGPSGAGKSTLIHLLIGGEQVSEGRIEVDGVELRDIPPPVLQLYRRRIGVVFQDYKLIAHRTVAENIAFPLEVCGVADAEIDRRVTELLGQMSLTEKASSLPDELSGGEKARTAIARAIVHQPLVLLADEPTGNLDPVQSLMILKLFQEIHRSGTTVLVATHDSTLVETLQTRVILLENGKVMRDAAGGYPQQSAKHDLLKEVEKPAVSAQAPVPSAPSDGSKKKVKVTMIHS
ncbi:MAG: ATP-binding cassette domain-containing protein [Candidatus Peribacteraceae bacterium]|nr:ATP-binding cassette domain-containing protein [Candidatus Peribacteraceae bacterium]